jgi:hypothetical protein
LPRAAACGRWACATAAARDPDVDGCCRQIASWADGARGRLVVSLPSAPRRAAAWGAWR